VKKLLPGLSQSLIVAIAATFLSEHDHASAMLFALLLEMSVNFLSQEGKCVDGIHFAASKILRIGVALLGLKISIDEIIALGGNTVGMILITVGATICFGALVARFTNCAKSFGILTGGAVAICGASAAMAISAMLPPHPDRKRDTTLAVIGVTALSTIAMVLYPMFVAQFGLDHRQARIFLRGTIHDVAQVVGARYGISNETGDAATIVKLLRVAMLVAVITILSFSFRNSVDTESRRSTPVLPWFVAAFVMIVLINSATTVPPSLLTFAGDASRWALVLAIAAMGMETTLKDLVVVGWQPVAMLVSETVFLAAAVMISMKYLSRSGGSSWRTPWSRLTAIRALVSELRE
jgi:uncharacterized integral membrane protein (TIGR00698 family)